MFATESTNYKSAVLTNIYTKVTMALQRYRMFILESFSCPFQVYYIKSSFLPVPIKFSSFFPAFTNTDSATREKTKSRHCHDYKSSIYLDPSPSTPKQFIGCTAFETGCKYHHSQCCWNSILSVLNKRMRGLDSSSSSVQAKLMLAAD